ncbi:hypothetical protein AB0D27_11345 [Streptomyces sp. NPDC048415]|uniref:hypothetical protein n=1 Tax=Streptomyces sp. NPDC048415 TaxID=3154822 RepID=UPI0034178788
MNYRPYPDVDRALAQLDRDRVPGPRSPLLASLEQVVAPLHLADWQREWVSALAGLSHAKRTGKSAITAAIVDEAVLAGEHVHIAGRDGMRCAGGDQACPLPRIGSGDQVVVEYDGHRTRYEVTDIPFRERPGSVSLTLRSVEGATEPDRLAEPQAITLARAIRTCTACPSQWDAWTVDGQYLYLRYRSGIGTVDAYDSPESEEWPQPPDGRIAIFDTGERYGGDMTLADFCERTGLQLADDAEVIGE